MNIQEYPIERHEARSQTFTEECASWRLPLDEVNIICDIATSRGMSVYPFDFSFLNWLFFFLNRD